MGLEQDVVTKQLNMNKLNFLEAEAVHIFREVAAEANHPVFLYSVGKDSAVMLHLALKAFYPAKPPFRFLHIDTTWKFREMIEFRDQRMANLGLELIVHTNPIGLAAGVGPFSHGSARHTELMKTDALKQALDEHGFDVAFGGARRDEEKSRKGGFSPSGPAIIVGTQRISALNYGRSTTPANTQVRASAYSLCPTGPSSTFGSIF